MIKNMMLVSILLIGFTGEVGLAKTASSKTKEGTKKSSSVKSLGSGNQMKSHLGTSFRFDGSSLHGKYQTSPSTTAMVEDDKWIDDLLGARKSFNDRIDKDRERN